MSEDCQGVRGEKRSEPSSPRENKIPEKRPRVIRVDGEFGDKKSNDDKNLHMFYGKEALDEEDRIAGWVSREIYYNTGKTVYILRTPEFANELWCLEEMKRKIPIIIEKYKIIRMLFTEDDIERARILKSTNYGKIALEVIHEGPGVLDITPKNEKLKN